MRIDQLIYFTEIAKYGSLNAAADKLYITQPALGNAITTLEKELGFPLIERTKSGTRLTKWGEQAFQIANDILNQCKDFELLRYAYNQNAYHEMSGELRIAAIKTFFLGALPESVAIFANSCPKVSLSILESNTFSSIKKILNNEIDLALVNVELIDSTFKKCFTPLGGDYEIIPLWDEKLYAVLSSSSDLAKKQMISLSQLSHRPLAINAFFIEDYVNDDFIKKYLPDCPIIFRSSDHNLVQSYISNSEAFGLAFINHTQEIKSYILNKIICRPIKEKIVVRFYAIFPKKTAQKTHIERFIEIINDLNDIKG